MSSSPDTGTDPVVDALNTEDEAAIQDAGSCHVGIDLVGMTMTNKDEEIKAINDVRNQFNTAVDARRAVLAKTITLLETNRTKLVTIVGGRDPADPIIKKGQDAIAVIDASLPAFKAEDADLAKLRSQVNNRLDWIIIDIKGSVFTYNYMPMFTYYTSEGYTA